MGEREEGREGVLDGRRRKGRSEGGSVGRLVSEWVSRREGG